MKNHNFNVFGIDVSSLLSILANSSDRLLVVIAIVFVIGIGIGINYKPTQKNPPLPTQTRQYTLVDYEKLRLGMLLVQVQGSLGGGGTETKRTTINRVFIWKNLDGSKITATFTDGKLTHKEQTGL
ncbi:MAG: hypothetical protein QNJ51_16750 [Calothrix sp. MO_167.B12]|nr:hypothetical protein [Calothrix sp. MO_167.B12]